MGKPWWKWEGSQRHGGGEGGHFPGSCLASFPPQPVAFILATQPHTFLQLLLPPASFFLLYISL